MKPRSSLCWRAPALVTMLMAALAATVGAQVDFINQKVVSDSIGSCLNLRPQADLGSAQIVCMEPGTRVKVLRTEGEWASVKLADGRQGWAASRFLDPASPGESADMAELEQELSSIAADKLAAERQRDGALAELEGLRKQLDSEQQARDDAEARLQSALDSATDLEAQVKRERGEVERSSQEATDRASLEAELATARRMLEASEATQAALRSEVATLRASLQQAEERVAHAESELERGSGDPAGTATDSPVLAVADAVPAEAAAAVVAESGVEVGGTLESSRTPMEPLIPAKPLVLQPPVPKVDPAADVEAAVRNWAEVWAAQDFDAYLAAYAKSFVPQGGLERPAWERLRRSRISGPAFVEIELTNVEIVLSGPERARGRFVQAYRSDTFSDVVTKVLVLVLEDGEWKIQSEEADGSPTK